MKKNKTIYISGKMTGCKNYNFLNFFRAERHLKKLGWNVINPARESWHLLKKLNAKKFSDIPLIEFIREDSKNIIEKSDAIYMLKGWEYSTGANAEFHLAKWKGIKIYYQDSL